MTRWQPGFITITDGDGSTFTPPAPVIPHGKAWRLNRKPRPNPNILEDCSWMEQPRKPIPYGEYGRVSFEFTKHNLAYLDILNPHLGLTADELREAAHMFNQIAEALEAQQP